MNRLGIKRKTKQMQLNKQNRKAARSADQPRHFSVPLEKFNPVMPKCYIVCASTWGTLEAPTHVAITTVKRTK
jgi:hypothetical protein